MQSWNHVCSLLFLAFTFLYHCPQVLPLAESSVISESRSPFSVALQNLQITINYTFQDVELLQRALTHASFSGANNRALSILGSTVIDSSVALHMINKNLDISPKDVNRRIADVAKVEGQCTTDGLHLGLEKVVRVSSKTNSSAPVVVCGAYRSILAAVAVDSGSLDRAGMAYLKIGGVTVGKAAAM